VGPGRERGVRREIKKASKRKWRGENLRHFFDLNPDWKTGFYTASTMKVTGRRAGRTAET
jgi:hypothetical protein